ncbi:MAG: BTAD domain-containing putative transcriptional regulator [Solirubrobacteraceae bacterium]|jgi:predicted ATPase/DNA-binding SARP family transcriptional activator
MRFGILGPLQVIGDDGRELALGGRMPRTVLAILLLRANEVVSSDRLVEELWAGAPPASAAKGLHVHVSRLRRALAASPPGLGGERLVTAAGGYLLRIAPDELDVQRCQRLIGEGRSLLAAGDLDRALAALNAALELWRGEVLCDFEYDGFAQAEIARLGELRAAVLEERVAVEMLLGRQAQVLGELERLVREYPFRERLRGQLMLALYRTGRQAEALAAYRTARSVLVDELGIEPSVELRHLHEAILAQDETLLEHDSAQPAASARARTRSDGRPLGHVHLPVQATPLIGRERELAELVELAGSHRLITLTGPGGTGKTRLALALAAELADRRADGVRWVSLAMVTEARLVPAAIARALGDVEDLPTYLHERAVLLVLDNFEQVIDAARAIGEMLSRAPGCSAIVTSRERLGVAAEQEYPVAPLSPHDAVELFTARARQAKPDFEPGPELDAICARLDRLPLALELAATRVKLLSEHQLLTRLEQRLPLLAGGRRDLPDRQSTMRATIAWSYDLLSEPEQRLFTRLAVFIGSFELEAAEQICDADLDTLQSLVDKSLLRRAENGRFFLLGTTREYALERFDASDERDDIRTGHARWYFALGLAAGGRDPERAEALTRLRQDASNVDLALSWALEHDIAAALPLADAVSNEWLGAGRIEELARWYGRALEDPAALSPGDRADALRGLGLALAHAERPGPARTALTEALALYREAGDERNEARVLSHLGTVEFLVGSPEGVLRWAEQALAICERVDDHAGIARSVHYIAEALRDLGEFERSAELYTRSIEIRRANGLGSGSATVHSLGDLSLDKGDVPVADRHYREALALALEEENVRLQAYCFAGLACVAARNGDATTAGRLWTLAECVEHAIGFRMHGIERVRYERNLTPPLRDSDEYRAGVADAADLDALTAAAEILHG